MTALLTISLHVVQMVYIKLTIGQEKMAGSCHTILAHTTLAPQLYLVVGAHLEQL